MKKLKILVESISVFKYGNMDRIRLIFIFLCFLTSCANQGRQVRIVSSSFHEAHPNQITLEIYDASTCMHHSILTTYFFVRIKNQYKVFERDALDKTKNSSFITDATRVIQALEEFEKRSKDKDTVHCGGYASGPGIFVRLESRTSGTEFGYCKKNWDGLKEFLAKIR